MLLEAVTTFNDGATRYYEGELLSANNFQPEDLKKFVEYGWLKEQGTAGSPLAQGVTATLDIKDGYLGHKSEF